MIPRQIAAAFPPSIRARGDEYVTQRRVEISAADSKTITAVVRGSYDYLVQLTAAPRVITASCECPFAGDNGICKHIWATLRVADSRKQLDLLTRNAGRDPSLVALSDDALDIDDIDDIDADESVDIGGAGDDEVPRALNREWRSPRREAERGAPPPPPVSHAQTHQRAPQRPPEWKTLLDSAQRVMQSAASGRDSAPPWPSDVRVVYLIDLLLMRASPGIAIELATERLRADGTWDHPVQFRFSIDTWRSIPDEGDRRIAQMLMGASYSAYSGHMRPGIFTLTGSALDITLPMICATGRCRLRRESGERPIDPIAFDSGEPWTLHVRVIRDAPGVVGVDATLRRAGEEMMLDEPALLHSAGVVIARDRVARLQHSGAFELVALFRDRKRLIVRDAELPDLLETLYGMPRRPPIELPADGRVTEQRATPRPCVVIHPDPSPWRGTHRRLELYFTYGGRNVTDKDKKASLFDRDTLTLHHRDVAFERLARERLAAAGAKEEWYYTDGGKCLALHGNKIMRLVADLVVDGWRVEADGAEYRAAGDARASVRSGIDWFELSAGIRYGDLEVSLQDLIAARRAGETTVELPDGSRGLIPAALLARLGPLVAGGTAVNGELRFAKSQTALLDALLAVLPEPDVDAAFEKARAELQAFDRVEPADPPPTFRGTLREYQREGLGWLHFLRAFGLGGCLADDMGLGKTIQVLALLESRRLERGSAKKRAKHPAKPSIVVLPRSLVFNWQREAERFTPELRLLDFTGTTRRIEDIAAAKTDVVLTTYGTLRRDAAALAGIEFDYAILDEAQAIKSGTSASAKAARLLRADHRLAITGTPIENRLEELWSIFEFLNPGMLGSSTTFATLVRLSRADDRADDGTAAPDRGVLARALRPVILRRTKTQVAPELPPRIEQTLHVELEGAQRKFYDGVLAAYRRSVLERVDRMGLGKSRMHILEALLRLRQAACHPALADPTKTAAPSAKLDALIPALEEVVAEGHKALVFSQFTSFLALVRARLDAAGTTYEYLDGSTRDRQARVERFQSDAACPLFLISLKAGGHGLNLTAAEYVFILDPWWNPAVEAQAVDRAHRIGQANRVIATRIVARDTIEEKILELQASKRALADAILGQDEGLLSQIGREDLAMLLG